MTDRIFVEFLLGFVVGTMGYFAFVILSSEWRDWRADKRWQELQRKYESGELKRPDVVFTDVYLDLKDGHTYSACYRNMEEVSRERLD